MIKDVTSKQDWNQFIGFPWKIYRGNPNWVPPLKLAVKELLSVNKNPFFKHAYLKAFLAYKNEEVVGRIAAIIDEEHNRFHQEQTGFFGFFECIDDAQVAEELISAATLWLKKRGMSTVRGPVNPSTNHECGFLVEGFDDPPSVMMTYNPPYYLKFFEKLGFKKAKDLFAYELDATNVNFSDRIFAQAEKLKARGNITFRPINMGDFKNELKRLLDIYNDAWEKNWGFVPMNEEEFHHTAKEMKMILDPDLLLFAEVKGQAVGFVLTLPDVHQAQIKVQDGKLLPFGLFKLLWNLKGPGNRKRISRCRILTLGVKKAYQPKGIGPLLYVETMKRGVSKGYKRGEASWILEDNIPMNSALQHMSAKKTKVYRIYEKPL